MDMATLSRTSACALLRRKILEEQSEASISSDDGTLQKMFDIVTSTFASLEAKITDINDEERRQVKKLLVVGRNYYVTSGSIDTILVVLDSRLHFHIYIYHWDVVEEGTLTDIQDIVSLVVLQKIITVYVLVFKGILHTSKA